MQRSPGQNGPGRAVHGSAGQSGNLLVPILGHVMRVIARNTLVDCWTRHPEAKVALERWCRVVRAANWTSTDDVQRAAPKSKVLNRERVRFEVAGGNDRLVAAFGFRRQVGLHSRGISPASTL